MCRTHIHTHTPPALLCTYLPALRRRFVITDATNGCNCCTKRVGQEAFTSVPDLCSAGTVSNASDCGWGENAAADELLWRKSQFLQFKVNTDAGTQPD